MSRNNKLTQLATVPAAEPNWETSSHSPPLIHNDITTFNININFGGTTSSSSEDQNRAFTKICSLIGHQLHDLRAEKHERKRRRSSRKGTPPPEEALVEVDALPLIEEQLVEVDAVPLFEEELIEVDATPKSDESEEFPACQEVPVEQQKRNRKPTQLQPPRKFRLVPAPRLKAVPEEELPKKRFSSGHRKRREYVELGQLSSSEVLNSIGPVLKEAAKESKTRKSNTVQPLNASNSVTLRE